MIAIPATLSLNFKLLNLAQQVRWAWGVSSGRRALDCVTVPEGLRYSPTPRAQRLMRGARMSAW